MTAARLTLRHCRLPIDVLDGLLQVHILSVQPLDIANNIANGEEYKAGKKSTDPKDERVKRSAKYIGNPVYNAENCRKP